MTAVEHLVEVDEQAEPEDDLNAARGIIVAVLLVLPLWVPIIWWVLL